MPSRSSLIFALLSLAPLVARADLQLDSDDISSACSSVCRPTRELTSTCDVDDDRIPSDSTENALNLQCVCTNTSFDVASLTALCASCMQQNPRDDDDNDDGDNDDLDDINEIMSRCGFSSTSYAASQSTAADAVTVVATRPSESAQLTTTISTGVGAAATSGTSSATTTGTGSSSSSSSTTGSSTGSSTASSTGTSTASSGTASSNNNVSTSAGSLRMEPFLGVWGAVAGAVAGIAVMGMRAW